MLPISRSALPLAGSQASFTLRPGKGNIQMKMSMKHWSNDEGKPKHPVKNLSQYYFVPYKSRMHCLGIELGSPP